MLAARLHAAERALADRDADVRDRGAGNAVASCDLRVFMDEAAEPVAAQNAHAGHAAWWIRSAVGRGLLECPVRPVRIVVVGVLAKDKPQVPSAGD